jgi:hypothetical protein
LEDLLVSLLVDLRRRSNALKDRLLAVQGPPPVNDLAVSSYQTVGTVAREVDVLLTDATVRRQEFRVDYYRRFRRWSELILLVENHAVPTLERFNEDDTRLTALAARITNERGIPLQPPVVTGFSSEYYWTLPFFNLVSVPSGELDGLFGIPDLGHEFGHLLLLAERPNLIGNLPRVIQRHFSEAWREASAQAAPHAAQLRVAEAQWIDDWLNEFSCDVVGTFLFGVSYALQHVRLCALFGDRLFAPTLGERAEHPANEARMRVIMAVLKDVFDDPDLRTANEAWAALGSGTSEVRPPNYDLCYPDVLVHQLALTVTKGCRDLGVIPANGTPSVASILRDAWLSFIDDPNSLSGRLPEIWSELEQKP